MYYRLLLLLLGLQLAVLPATAPAACLSAEPVQVVIRNDDICALSQVDWERKLLAVFRQYHVPLSVGVVPAIAGDTRYRPEVDRHPLDENPEIVQLYRQAAREGWVDIQQHGYDHQQNPAHAGLPPARSSEFIGLPLEVQKARIARGRALIEQQMGTLPRIFIPPWNNGDANTEQALIMLGFAGLSDTRLWLLAESGKKPLPSRMIYFDQLDATLRQWEQKGQCKGELPAETVVVLYHSWEDYHPEGPGRLAGYLRRLRESGVKLTTLSAILQPAVSAPPAIQSESHPVAAPVTAGESP